MCAWSENNFKQILQTWGTVMYISPFFDEEDCYITPKILFETEIQKKLEFNEKVTIENQLFSILVIETWEPACRCCNS